MKSPIAERVSFDRAWHKDIRPMIPRLTFRAGVFDRETVGLGAEEIGEILPQAGDYVAYRVALHGVRGAFLRAESTARARGAIERLVNEWLNRLGLFHPGLSVEVMIVDAAGQEHRGGSEDA